MEIGNDIYYAIDSSQLNMSLCRSRLLASGIAVGAVHLLRKDGPVINSPALAEYSPLVSATFNANSPTEDRNFKHSAKGWHVGGILDGTVHYTYYSMRDV